MAKRYFLTEKHLNCFFKKHFEDRFDDYYLRELFVCYLQLDDICYYVSRLSFIVKEKEKNIEEIENIIKILDLKIKYNDEKEYNIQKYKKIFLEMNNYFTKQFEEFVLENFSDSGIYFFYNSKKELIYIGKSKSLGSRIQSSSKERNARFVRVCKIENKADLHILELYYINLFKPPLNTDCKEEIDVPSFKLNHELIFLNDFLEIFDEEKIKKINSLREVK